MGRKAPEWPTTTSGPGGGFSLQLLLRGQPLLFLLLLFGQLHGLPPCITLDHLPF